MRIGQVTYTYKPITGGGDVYADMLAALLHREGISQRVYQREASIEDDELRFVPNPLARFGRGEFWTQAFFLRRLKDDLLREDLVIAHYPNYLLAVRKLRQGDRPRILGLSHGVTWDDRPGALRSRIKRALARRAFALADGFVANDTFFLREMGLAIAPQESPFAEIGNNRWYIPNCVPPGFRAGKPLAELEASKAIIVPRNLYWNRGIHLAIEAFAIFARQFPETCLLIVGKESQPAYVAQLKRRTSDLGLQEKVIFWGHVSHEEMLDIYASGQMCVIPSICGEGTSLAALEAMACGLATIVTDVAGLKDLPAVHAAAAPEALAKAMCETYPARAQTGRAQQAQVTQDFSYERWSQAWLNAIRQTAALND